MTLPKFILELQDRENQVRFLQAIRTRYLLILGVWTLVVVTYLLWGMSFCLVPIHIVAGATLIVNTVYYYLLRKWRFPLVVAIVSTAVDMIIITVLVYYTGGLSSMFFLLYLVQILGASLFLNLTFSALMILWAMILIGVMGALETAELVAPSAIFAPTAYSEFLNTVVWFIFQAMALCLVAFLGGNLSNKLKFKERELKQKMEMEKLYEALRKADESKSRLLANVSHNLRTPLTSILGFSELLLGKGVSESQRDEFSKIIHGESQHLTRLVKDIIYLWELEGKVEWHMAEVDISKILTEAVDAMQGSALQKGLTLTIDSRAAPPLVYSDFDALKDVVTRLIDNAIKFTIEGVIRVGVVSEAGNVCVYVSDTGIGIVADIGDRIFEPLVEIYKAEHEGVPQRTGLGLAICKAVIQQHGGKIWFESKLGEGSTFFFTVPLVKT